MPALTKHPLIALALAATLLASCERDQPPAPTTEQTGQLNEAEDLLNELDKQEGAAPSGTAPSQNEVK